MKLFLSMAVAVATFMGSLSYAGNGFERSEVDEMVSLRKLDFGGMPLNERTKQKVAAIVENAMNSAVAFAGVAYTQDIKTIDFDQGLSDLVYDMHISTVDEFGVRKNLHLVLRESSASNPAFDRYEVIEISKKQYPF